MEAVGGVAYLLAGSNIFIMRHPESIRLVHSYINAMSDGMSLEETVAITKLLAGVDLDLTLYAPDPDLTIEEEQKPAAKAAAPVKQEAKPEPAQPEEKAEAKTDAAPAKGHKALLKPPPNKPGRLSRTPVSSTASPTATTTPEPQQLKELEAMRALAAEKLAEEEKRKQAEAAALKKIKEQAEAKMQEEAAKEKEHELRLRREEEEKALKAQRAKTRHHAEPVVKLDIAKATPAASQLDELEKIMERLNRMHHRV